MKRAPLHLVRKIVMCLVTPVALGAHPMGNFSVNHYSRLHLTPGGAEVTYVMDLAEIPSFELMEQWKADVKDHGIPAQAANRQAQEWIDNVFLIQAGTRILLQLKSVTTETAEGAAGLPTLRFAITAAALPKPGEFTYEDRNFPGRAGWKEIVIDHDPATAIGKSSQSSEDISKGLTYYPADPLVSPPQDLTARVQWSYSGSGAGAEHGPGTLPSATASSKAVQPIPAVTPVVPVSKPEEQPETTSFSAQQPDGPGSVVQGDFLSRMLQRKELGVGIMLLGILAAFGLGALHAMSPGHGKTIVAAYLVGSRGTLQHAALLGLVVTFTHTFTVFLLGLGMLFFQQYFVAEKIFPVLGSISGISIVLVGTMLLYQRGKALLDGGSGHSHSHDGYFHTHEFAPGDSEANARPFPTRIAELRAAEGRAIVSGGDSAPALVYAADTDGLVHSHGGSTHSHMIGGAITPASLIALGISGGIVPCPSALILMLSAIALGHPGLGLVLLVGFSSGLALVLMAFGMLAIYAKHLLPNNEERMKTPLFRLIPVFSAVVVICLGMIMTAVSAGWVKPLRFLS